MSLESHINEEQCAGYRTGALSPVDLLVVDAHISGCARCRDRLYIQTRASSATRSLRSGLSGHLDFSAIAACSEGCGLPRDLAHVRECPACQADVQDLSRFRTELIETPRKPIEAPIPWRRYARPLAIGAAVALLVAVGLTAVVRSKGNHPAPAAAAEHADPTLPMPEREIMEKVLTARRFDRSPLLDALISARADASAPLSNIRVRPLDLLSPVGTAVLTDLPVFSWTPPQDALEYIVTVFDAQSQKVVESPVLTNAEWRPPAALPRGQVLSWRVRARTRSGVIEAPVSPLPPARFEVLPREVIDRIESLRKDHPGNPLLVAALYARAGALDDAEAMLKLLDSAVGQPYRESLRALRNSD